MARRGNDGSGYSMSVYPRGYSSEGQDKGILRTDCSKPIKRKRRKKQKGLGVRSDPDKFHEIMVETYGEEAAATYMLGFGPKKIMRRNAT